MASLIITATMEIRGVNPYVLVSEEQAARLKPGWRKPLPVTVRVNGRPEKPWHINMMPTGSGSFYLYLHGDVRKASGTVVGDSVMVELAFDESYVGGPGRMPGWFAAALDGNKRARDNWDKLPPSRQKEIIRYLTTLKSSAARQRNIQKTLLVLAGANDRFMGRAWHGGA